VTHTIENIRSDADARAVVEDALLRRGDPRGAEVVALVGGVAGAGLASELCDALVEGGLGARGIELCILTRCDGDALIVLGGAGAPRLRRRRIRLDVGSTLTEAVKTGALVAVRDDAALEARYGATREGDRALVAVPVKRGGDVRGALGVRLQGGHELSANEEALLTLLADIVASALPRFELQAAERTRSSELEAVSHRTHALARISRELAEAGLVEDAILERAARGVSEVFGDACAVRILDGATLRTTAMHPTGRDGGGLGTILDGAVDEPTRTALARGRAILATRLHGRVAVDVPLRKVAPLTSVMCAPIAPAGLACGVLVVMRERGAPHSEDDRLVLEDLSYRVGLALGAARAYAAEQQARQRAERAARGRDRVLSAVSHDLRAPLATVHLAATLLLDMGPEHDGFSDIVQRIGRATQRMRRLVEDLLDLGQLETGVLRVRRARVSVRRVIEETVDELEARARSAGKRLASEPATSLEVLGDIERLQQVLVNLVVNAIDHTPRGTSVRIGAQQDGERAVLWVEDDGPGIDPELIERLFEPNVRGKGATVHGAGLGLWIARGLVEAHGGELRVGAGSSGGARFELRLPLA
jgi:signal transduction histidine kinase